MYLTTLGNSIAHSLIGKHKVIKELYITKYFNVLF